MSFGLVASVESDLSLGLSPVGSGACMRYIGHELAMYWGKRFYRCFYFVESSSK
jgi:hypothetical protein